MNRVRTKMRLLLRRRGLTQKELARRMGRPEKTLSEIANGKCAVTPATAFALQEHLYLPARRWLVLQAEDDLDRFLVELTPAEALAIRRRLR